MTLIWFHPILFNLFFCCINTVHARFMASCCAVARMHHKKILLFSSFTTSCCGLNLSIPDLFSSCPFFLHSLFWSVFCISPAEERGPPCLALTGSGFAVICRPPQPSPLLCLFFSFSPWNLSSPPSRYDLPHFAWRIEDEAFLWLPSSWSAI